MRTTVILFRQLRPVSALTVPFVCASARTGHAGSYPQTARGPEERRSRQAGRPRLSGTSPRFSGSPPGRAC